MASHLACVGLDASDSDQLASWFEDMLQHASPLGSRGGLDVLRYEDPSGARVTFELRKSALDNFLPSFAGRWRTRLADVRPLSRDVSHANVMDEDGEQLTAMTLELEERALLDASLIRADATVVALAREFKAFEDADAFSASNSSYLGDPAQAGDPPEDVVAMGWPWPPRYAPESFMSTGIFDAPETADAYAILNGSVLDSELRTNAVTGQAFHVLCVHTVGFDVDICVAAADITDLIEPGMVVASYSFMVGSLESWSSRPARSWWRRLSNRN